MIQTEDGIGAYLVGLLILSAVASAVLVFAPEGGTKKYLRYLAALIISLALLQPLAGLIAGLPRQLKAVSGGVTMASLPTGLPSAEELIINYTAEKLSAELKYELKRKFGVEAGILLSLDAADPQNIVIEHIFATVNDPSQKEAVERYLSLTLLCGATVTAGEGEG